MAFSCCPYLALCIYHARAFPASVSIPAVNFPAFSLPFSPQQLTIPPHWVTTKCAAAERDLQVCSCHMSHDTGNHSVEGGKAQDCPMSTYESYLWKLAFYAVRCEEKLKWGWEGTFLVQLMKRKYLSKCYVCLACLFFVSFFFFNMQATGAGGDLYEGEEERVMNSGCVAADQRMGHSNHFKMTWAQLFSSQAYTVHT